MLVVAAVAVDERSQRKNPPSRSSRVPCSGRPEIREALTNRDHAPRCARSCRRLIHRQGSTVGHAENHLNFSFAFRSKFNYVRALLASTRFLAGATLRESAVASPFRGATQVQLEALQFTVSCAKRSRQGLRSKCWRTPIPVGRRINSALCLNHENSLSAILGCLRSVGFHQSCVCRRIQKSHHHEFATDDHNPR